MNIFQKVTIKTLRKNRTRTVVTLIGIILSLSMFTAVTVSISSFQNHLLNMAKLRDGNWHISVPATIQEKDALSSEKSIQAVSFLENIGYARLADSINPEKPYLFLGGMDEQAQGILPMLLKEGRLPQNENELLIPEHLSYNGGVSYALGETVTLEIGTRRSGSLDGSEDILWQDTPYLYTEEEKRAAAVSKQKYQEANGGQKTEDANSGRDMEGAENGQDFECFSPEGSHTYEIVGIYARPSIEPYTAPGYTALTVSSQKEDDFAQSTYTAYLRFHNPKDAMPWLEAHYPDGSGTDANYDLLRMYAASYESSYDQVLYGLGSVLIVIILFGSISLIYNAFSISVTERTKQFGLLASLGATKRQLLHSVLFEALALCVFGIPLGILAGIAGIGITFSVVGSSMSNILWGDWASPLSLHVTPAAVAVAALIGLFTVLISAYLPARRSAKLSPLEAIRLTADIHIRPQRIKTFRLTYRIFGLSGMLASKNFKRNRKKYRATVISLFVSIVLFISASSFCSYLLDSAKSVMSDAGCDIAYRRYPDDTDLSDEEVFEQLSSLSSVSEAAYVRHVYSQIWVSKDDLGSETLSDLSAMSATPEGKEKILLDVPVFFINDQSYAAYLKEAGLDDNAFLEGNPPLATASDFWRDYNSTNGKYTTFHIFNSNQAVIELLQIQSPEGYRSCGYAYPEESKNGEPVYYFENEADPEEELLEIPMASCTRTISLDIGAIPEYTPFFLGDLYSGGLMLLYPVSAMETVLGQDRWDAMEGQNKETTFYFTASDHTKAMEDISQTLQDLGIPASSVYDYAEEAAQQRTLLTIITIFSYGFIILISLIAIANVFNTISTNIQLRKREFAMLRSTGMTPKGFTVMMCYECLLYGIKSLLYGLPVSILVTFRIYRSVSAGWVTDFYIPWYSLVIAIGSVFLVVGSTMIYSMHKIGKENIMDNLKNENI